MKRSCQIVILWISFMIVVAQPHALPQQGGPFGPGRQGGSGGGSPPPQTRFLSAETAHYKIYSMDQAVLDDLKNKIETVYKKYQEVFQFDELPRKAIIRIYGSKQDFAVAARAVGVHAAAEAFYLNTTKELIGYKTGSISSEIIFHEGVHQIMDMLNPKLYSNSGTIPMWFFEGLADCFACSTFEKGVFHLNKLDSAVAQMRLRYAKKLFEGGKATALSSLIGQEHQTFMKEAMANYSLSWTLCHFLWNYPEAGGEKGKYKKVIEIMIAELKKGPKSIEDANRAAFQGLDLKKLEGEWKEYVLKTMK